MKKRQSNSVVLGCDINPGISRVQAPHWQLAENRFRVAPVHPRYTGIGGDNLQCLKDHHFLRSRSFENAREPNGLQGNGAIVFHFEWRGEHVAAVKGRAGLDGYLRVESQKRRNQSDGSRREECQSPFYPDAQTWRMKDLHNSTSYGVWSLGWFRRSLLTTLPFR